MIGLSDSEWDDFLSKYPNAHILQIPKWGKLKSEYGWDVERIVSEGVSDKNSAGAQVLFRRLPLGFTIAYIPRGPIGSHWEYLWPEIDALCKSRRAVFLKVEPDVWENSAGDSGISMPPGFQKSEQMIQPARTLIVDLCSDEASIMGRMKQKTRYNIRLALKKGVVVSSSEDIQSFYDLMTVTGERDQFGVHSIGYYQHIHDYFAPRGECNLFIAEYEGTPLAGIIAFTHGDRAWYFYGASSNQYREMMPNYLLQWEAIRWARSLGCVEYDLWGVPDVDEDILEANFTKRSDGLWGVYRFKRGFGGELRRVAGPWDRVYNPVMYKFYQVWARNR